MSGTGESVPSGTEVSSSSLGRTDPAPERRRSSRTSDAIQHSRSMSPRGNRPPRPTTSGRSRRGRDRGRGPLEQVADLVVGRLREVLVPEADGVERLGRDGADAPRPPRRGTPRRSPRAAIGTATTMRAGPCCRRAATAARMRGAGGQAVVDQDHRPARARRAPAGRRDRRARAARARSRSAAATGLDDLGRDAGAPAPRPR